jgi:hypothetical protein
VNALLCFGLALSLPAAAMAQAPAPVSTRSPAVTRAANTITEQDVRRRITLIAHDSMGGRDTPSPGLEKTAAYIASEFQRFGLKPGGDNGTFIQRYGVLRRVLDSAVTTLDVSGSRQGTMRFGVDFSAAPFAALPERGAPGPVVVLAGPPDSLSPFGGESIVGAWVVVAAPGGTGGRGRLGVDIAAVRAAAMGGAAGVLMVSQRTDADWHAGVTRALRPAVSLEGESEPFQIGPLLEVRAAAAQRLLGIDSTMFRSPSRVARRLPGVTLSFKGGYRVLSRVSAPNVVGILEGSDPELKNEYLVYSAHMDHVGTAGVGGGGGCQARGADSICNGADDDASGTVAVIEAAEAFAQLQPRPRRSMIFLTVSGEEHGLWGSAFFADHPPVPASQLIANLNADMVGRNWRDTIVAIGKEHSDLGATLERVTAAHPELNMKAIDDLWPTERFYFRSDHYNFARKGVPILFFFNGTHPDYHQVTDHADKIDAEKEARIIKLLFFLGLEVANAPTRPKWNPESYRQIVQPTMN